MELPLLQLVFLVFLVALPIASKKVEHNLELFFLVMAVAGATLAGIWSHELLKEALLHPLTVYQPSVGYVPIGITQVVLVADL
jgi:predicted cation transporter